MFKQFFWQGNQPVAKAAHQIGWGQTSQSAKPPLRGTEDLKSVTPSVQPALEGAQCWQQPWDLHATASSLCLGCMNRQHTITQGPEELKEAAGCGGKGSLHPGDK